ncbi:MAG: segregation/condensation protein A [Antricoccus sp.]
MNDTAPSLELKNATGLENQGTAPAVDRTKFTVHLTNFEGPFDLLLQLIGKHKLDVTEVALSKVTDEFIAYIRALGSDWDLGQATEFLLVAATLLDLKTARLLPKAQIEDEEDLALLEARDLLFARLLQYRAYKHVAGLLAQFIATAGKRYPRAVSLEPQFAAALPEVLIGVGPERFAQIAVRAMTPKTPAEIRLDHLHASTVSVSEQITLMRGRLADAGALSFRDLTDDCEHTMEVVARFLGLLELYRERLVSFEQHDALGELRVQWTGAAADLQAAAAADYDPDEEYE